MKQKKILIFGAGKWGEEHYQEVCKNPSIKVLAFLDNKPKGKIIVHWRRKG